MFNDLTDDLTPGQFQQMLHYVWSRQGGKLNRAAVKAWRRSVGLPV